MNKMQTTMPCTNQSASARQQQDLSRRLPEQQQQAKQLVIKTRGASRQKRQVNRQKDNKPARTVKIPIAL